MSAPINNLTEAEIRARLADNAARQRAHAARDMDAEMAAILKTGGDVDALEASQLEAERQARRLRVERQALGAELPISILREGEASLAAKVSEHAQLAQRVAEQIDVLTAAWSHFRQQLEAWEAVQLSAVALTEEAERVAKRTGAAMPTLGNFLSNRLCGVSVEAQYLSNRFLSAEHAMQVGFKTQSHRCD